jgi:hypothetical protein
VQAESIALYANGVKVHEKAIESSATLNPDAGIKFSEEFLIDRPGHDVHLVAIALGAGVDGLFWKTAKPYQPLSPDWRARTLGCSGEVWLDVDGDGRPTPAFAYAERLIGDAKELAALLDSLSRYDESVAAQAADLWYQRDKSLFTPQSQAAIANASPPVRAGFERFLEARRENERARAEGQK